MNTRLTPPRKTALLLSFFAVISANAETTVITKIEAENGNIAERKSEAPSADTVLPEVKTVSSIRSSGDVETSPRAISVVDKKTLSERPGANGIQAALEEVPGIQFARSGGLGGQLVVRGFNSNQSRSILTVDGDRYRGRTTLEFNMFDPNAIERIEVIRGPASALYGADAMNGVVNIVTRRAKADPDQPFTLTPRVRSLEFGSVNNMRGTRLELSGGGQGFDVLIGASARKANDYDTPAGHAKNSEYESQGLDYNIGYRPTSDSRWEISGRYQKVSTGRAGGLGAAPGLPIQEVTEDPIVERYTRLAYQGKNFGKVADTLDASLYVRQFKTDIYQANRSNPAVTVSPHLKVYTPTVWGGHLIAMKGVGNHLISYGSDFFRENFAGRERQITQTNPASGAVIGQSTWQTIDRHSWQTNVGAFISDEWQTTDRLMLTGALRYDWVKVRIGHAIPGENPAQTTEFGDHPGNRETAWTGNLGAVYKLTPIWSLATNVSHSFRAPSGNELTMTSTAGTITTLPTPNLKPETNNTVELALRWNTDDHRGSLNAYQSRYNDLISTVVVSPTERQRLNVSTAVIRGLELEGQKALSSNLRLNYMLTATRATDKSTREPLPGIAPLGGRLALRYQRDQWYAEGVTRGYKGKTRIDHTQERKGSSYAMLDLYAGANLDKFLGESWRGWKLVGGVENVFDRLGRNPAIAEDINYARGRANPLVEPGRNLVIKLTSDF